MQEFTTVSTSSYDAASLTPMLNEKSSDGWSVVSIVAAGANVVAYLQREADPNAAAQPAAAQPVPVEEPAGWASAPESTASEPVVVVASTPEPTPEPVVQAAASADPAVPAGWYADPSGRFELRYWDGSAWTEHVSRAGQQATDPPVA